MEDQIFITAQIYDPWINQWIKDCVSPWSIRWQTQTCLVCPFVFDGSVSCKALHQLKISIKNISFLWCLRLTLNVGLIPEPVMFCSVFGQWVKGSVSPSLLWDGVESPPWARVNMEEVSEPIESRALGLFEKGKVWLSPGGVTQQISVRHGLQSPEEMGSVTRPLRIPGKIQPIFQLIFPDTNRHGILKKRKS